VSHCIYCRSHFLLTDLRADVLRLNNGRVCILESARIKDWWWVQEPFLCGQQPSKGARTDAFPVQSLVRIPLVMAKQLERVGPVPEYNR
jgi:hypothetical protein